MSHTPRFELNPGRHIYRDGKPFVYVGGTRDPEARGHQPAEWDDFARKLVHAVNNHDALVEALRIIAEQCEAMNVGTIGNICPQAVARAALAAVEAK